MSTLREATIRLAFEDAELRPLLLPLLREAKDEDEDEKEGKFERGEDVPVSELPEELQENVKDPPPSVQKVKQKIKEKNKSATEDERDLFGEAVRLAAENPNLQELLLPVLSKYADSAVPGDDPNPSDEKANEMGWDPGSTEEGDKKAADDDRALLHETIRLAIEKPELQERLLPVIREATVLPLLGDELEMLREAKGEPPKGGRWTKMPKGWTAASRKKFWDSLTGDAEHKVTECMKKMEGKVDDTGAFCAALKDRVSGTTKWRGPDKKKAADEWLGIDEVRALCPSCADRMESYNLRTIKASVIQRAIRRSQFLVQVIHNGEHAGSYRVEDFVYNNRVRLQATDVDKLRNLKPGEKLSLSAKVIGRSGKIVVVRAAYEKWKKYKGVSEMTEKVAAVKPGSPEEQAKMYEKGYRYIIRFPRNDPDPLYTKTQPQAAKLLREDYKDKKNVKIEPITPKRAAIKQAAALRRGTEAEFQKVLANAGWPKPEYAHTKRTMDVYYKDRGTEVAHKSQIMTRGKVTNETFLINPDYLEKPKKAAVTR